MAENVSRTSRRKLVDYFRAKKQESETQIANKTTKASIMINEVQAGLSVWHVVMSF